jgi:Tol biopolymer transport system component
MNADGTDVTRLTNTRGADRNPSWSPDGMKIAFSSYEFKTYARYERQSPLWIDILMISVNGKHITNITKDAAMDDHPSWSPDGRKIAFTSKFGNNDDIYVMVADGSRKTRITNDPAKDSQPSWSPSISTK